LGQHFLFNGEPQAQANPGNDACGLPLNEQHFINRRQPFLPELNAPEIQVRT
jgi:hypothetical protein